MADDQDDAQKTEEPTQKKLDEAHKKGEVAKSQEIRHWFMIAAGGLALALFADDSASRIKESFYPYIAQPHLLSVDAAGLINLVHILGGQVASALFIPFLLFMAAAVISNVIQHKPVFAFDKIIPKLEKISILKGFKRLFSVNSLMEFLKSLLKLTIVSAAVAVLIWPERERLPGLIGYDISTLLVLIETLALRMFVGVVAVLGIIAANDFLFQRLQHNKKQRMTKQEVRDEHKQLEGDPMIKARLRQVRLERAKKRMMAAVPEADVVITNPTHFAVALRYDQTDMEAPKVIAKGVDSLAHRIREMAAEFDIPVVENPPLARTLYATVEVDDFIMPEHYKAVAEVISYVFGLKRRGVHAAAS